MSGHSVYIFFFSRGKIPRILTAATSLQSVQICYKRNHFWNSLTSLYRRESWYMHRSSKHTLNVKSECQPLYSIITFWSVQFVKCPINDTSCIILFNNEHYALKCRSSLYDSDTQHCFICISTVFTELNYINISREACLGIHSYLKFLPIVISWLYSSIFVFKERMVKSCTHTKGDDWRGRIFEFEEV